MKYERTDGQEPEPIRGTQGNLEGLSEPVVINTPNTILLGSAEGLDADALAAKLGKPDCSGYWDTWGPALNALASDPSVQPAASAYPDLYGAEPRYIRPIDPADYADTAVVEVGPVEENFPDALTSVEQLRLEQQRRSERGDQ